MKKITKSAKETQNLAKALATQILPTSQDGRFATVVALTGDLGSGKTTFTQGLAKALKINEKITSPTFVILKKYKNLIHIDAYRIQKPKEILDLNWKEIVNNPENIIIVEWAEKIEKILPRPYFGIKISHKKESERTIDISIVK